MEVVTIDSRVWIELNQRLGSMEVLLLSFVTEIRNKSNHQPYSNISNHIYLEDALIKHKISRVTINKKIKKYKIEKEKRGRRVVINEDQLIAALKKKEPKPKFN